jgi:hypothetical protein
MSATADLACRYSAALRRKPSMKAQATVTCADCPQILRARSHKGPDPHVTFGIRRMEVLGEPGMDSLERKLRNGHLDALERRYRPARKEDLDRLDHLAAAECWSRRTAAEQDLVQVVMQDEAEALAMQTAEGDAERLGQGIADTVRMAQPLALHDLHGRAID